MTSEPPPYPGEPNPADDYSVVPPASAEVVAAGAPLPTNRKAILSVVFGALAFPSVLFISWFLAFILAVPSITCGVHARREIRASKGAEGGDTTAAVGLTIGATSLALVLLSRFVLPYVTG